VLPCSTFNYSIITIFLVCWCIIFSLWAKKFIMKVCLIFLQFLNPSTHLWPFIHLNCLPFSVMSIYAFLILTYNSDIWYIDIVFIILHHSFLFYLFESPMTIHIKKDHCERDSYVYNFCRFKKKRKTTFHHLFLNALCLELALTKPSGKRLPTLYYFIQKSDSGHFVHPKWK
jgi:hypothetical protein